MKKGWKGESQRHSTARKGVKTVSNKQPENLKSDNFILNGIRLKVYDDWTHKSRQRLIDEVSKYNASYGFYDTEYYYVKFKNQDDKREFVKWFVDKAPKIIKDHYDIIPKRGFYVIKSKLNHRVVETFEGNDKTAYNFPKYANYENPEEYIVVKTGGF